MLDRKPHHKSLDRRKSSLSRKGLSRAKARLHREGNFGGLKAIGNNKHSKDWRKAWPKLKRKFEREGITRCEECGSDYFLTPAHSLKRRHITNDSELNEVALLCQPHHEKYELQGEEKMCAAIRGIIARREYKLPEAA
jgi:hypothetical protein